MSTYFASGTGSSSVTVSYDSWQVQSTDYGTVRVGQSVLSPLEFTPRGPVTVLDGPGRPGLEPVDGTRYAAVATVVDHERFSVLDLGHFKAVTKVYPGMLPKLRPGQTVSLTLDLSFSAWIATSDHDAVVAQFDVETAWPVLGISVFSIESAMPVRVAEATWATVPDGGFCLVECALPL